MSTSVPSQLQVSDLIPLVRQALGKPTIEIVDWQSQRFSGSASEFFGGLGIYRVSGTARDQDGDYSWSLILKITSGSEETSSLNPTAWDYWKREVLVYQSGLLDNLPGSLSAPKCYAVTEHPNNVFWIWLEDVRESSREWTMAQYGLAARQLGTFNGAYLAGHPLPEAQPWMTWGRTREWMNFIPPTNEAKRLYAEGYYARRLFRDDGFYRTLKLSAQREKLLEAFERLPVCYCHHDAFRRNLLARQNTSDIVAIDWSITGFGRVGEEVGISIANNVMWLEVPVSQAKELDQMIFSGYMDGLREADWKGDVRLARLGYTVNAALVMGLAWPMYHLSAMQNADWAENTERMNGHPVEAVLEAWSSTHTFLLDLADEALQLADELR